MMYTEADDNYWLCKVMNVFQSFDFGSVVVICFTVVDDNFFSDDNYNNGMTVVDEWWARTVPIQMKGGVVPNRARYGTSRNFIVSRKNDRTLRWFDPLA